MERVGGNASMIRANAIIAMASGLLADRSGPTRSSRDLRVSLGSVVDGSFQANLSFSTGSPDVARAVARREIDVAAINPSAYLTMAYRGTGLFPEPLPVRVIAMMPSWDRMVFAIAERTGITSLAQIRDRKYPLKVSVRGAQSHATRFVIDEALAVLGFSLKDIESWGGSLQFVEAPSDAARLAGIRDGSLDAVWDEGIKSWGNLGLESGFQWPALEPEVLGHLKAQGWPIGPIPRADFPAQRSDIEAVSFGGWPIFTHSTLPDDVAYAITSALDAARPTLVWDAPGAVELSDLCLSTDAAPRDVPLHAGAERYYREQGCFS